MRGVTNQKLITCIVPRGIGTDLVEVLNKDMGTVTTNVATGRGVSARQGFFSEEVDILTVIADEDHADALFEYLYFAVDAGDAKGRFMYQESLDSTTPFELPEHVEEEEQ